MQFSQPSPSVLLDPIMAKMNAFKVSIAYGISYCYLQKEIKKMFILKWLLFPY